MAEKRLPASGSSRRLIPKKDPHAVALGRKGGIKGGKARAARLTPEQRSEMASRAAKARWAKYKPSKG